MRFCVSDNAFTVPYLLNSYENAEVALNTGMILHEMLRHEPLAKTLLYSERLYDFIGYIDKTTFGIACDAMANFKELLTKHKPMVAEFLEQNYDEVRHTWLTKQNHRRSRRIDTYCNFSASTSRTMLFSSLPTIT